MSLSADGYLLLRKVFSEAECSDLTRHVERALAEDHAGGGLRTARQALYGGRNLLRASAEVRDSWRRGPLLDLLRKTLGPRAGLVRVLYFDKPPGATWSLAWHRDRTIAVAGHPPELGPFRCPTVKAGVPHVEAPRELLATLLTLRIHLDAMTEENGPLLVIPGSHAAEEESPVDEMGRTILAERGDVLAMRPLLLHASRASLPGCSAHRRVLHLEFAPSPDLPGGLAWHDFVA